jgi:hypothetical protein
VSLITIDCVSSFKGSSESTGPSPPSQLAEGDNVNVQPPSERLSSPARPVPMTDISHSFDISLLIIAS